MEKARKIIGAVLAIAGIFTAVCLVDGSCHEITIRFGGLLAFVAGILIMPQPEKSEA